MHHWKILTVIVLLAGIALLGLSRPAHTEEQEGSPALAAKISELLDQAKIGLADAVIKAEARVGGKACAAQMELDDEGLIFEVLVVKKGETVRLYEVEIDAKTGEFLADDDEDGDDDDDDDDDDDGDDDDDDNDDD